MGGGGEVGGMGGIEGVNRSHQCGVLDLHTLVEIDTDVAYIHDPEREKAREARELDRRDAAVILSEISQGRARLLPAEQHSCSSRRLTVRIRTADTLQIN